MAAETSPLPPLLRREGGMASETSPKQLSSYLLQLVASQLEEVAWLRKLVCFLAWSASHVWHRGRGTGGSGRFRRRGGGMASETSRLGSRAAQNEMPPSTAFSSEIDSASVGGWGMDSPLG
jgi:hypothetical protein